MKKTFTTIKQEKKKKWVWENIRPDYSNFVTRTGVRSFVSSGDGSREVESPGVRNRYTMSASDTNDPKMEEV